MHNTKSKKEDLYYLIRTDFYEDNDMIEYKEGPYPLTTAKIRENQLLSLVALPRVKDCWRKSCRVRMERFKKKEKKTNSKIIILDGAILFENNKQSLFKL